MSPQNTHILVVEDEQNVASFIKKGLEDNLYQVTLSYDGESAIELIKEKDFHLVVLDLILPQANGWEVCKKIRQELRKNMPILMLTALNSTENVVKGLELGADDYLGKPFKFNEFLARVKALTRRHLKQNSDSDFQNILEYKDLSLNLESKEVFRSDTKLKLTAKEFNLLEYLMRNKGKVMSRNEILEHVWGINFDLGTNVVDVYVNYLRNKIDKNFDPKLIHTVIGMGYVFRDDYDN